LRFVRSPEAPKMTIVQGSPGLSCPVRGFIDMERV
jgi:hypothetical protein